MAASMEGYAFISMKRLAAEMVNSFNYIVHVAGLVHCVVKFASFARELKMLSWDCALSRGLLWSAGVIDIVIQTPLKNFTIASIVHL